MSLWSPTHVQFTVLRARNLIAKGKGGNNDVFVTIQLGKEKYQTSTIKNALNPEWFEECDLPISHMGLEIEVSLYHRRVLSDDFLGYAAIPLWEYKITETSKSSWVTLHNKSSKPDGNKYRGELEVKLTFHCQNRPDAASHGLRKRSPSIRNLTSAFGDKFKLTRSRSFREPHRRESESGTMEKCQENSTGAATMTGSEDTLTRSYSMSAAYIRSMSLDRSRMANYFNGSNVANNSTSNIAVNGNNSNSRNKNFTSNRTETGLFENNSQSLYALPVSRRSSDIPFHQLPPPPYDLKPSSQDDSALPSADNRPLSEHQINSSVLRSSLPSSSSNFEPARREVSGIYESIKERTEPENTVSSTSDPESVPMPRPRGKKFSKRESGRNISLPLSGGRVSSGDQQPFNGRDSGILDDRSSSLGNSLEGSLAATDGTNNGSKTRSQPVLADIMDQPKLETQLSGARGDRGLLYHLDREMSLNGSMRSRKKMPPPSLFYSKENKYGELVVRKRTRGQRDRDRNRFLQVRQGTPGLYDDSASDRSDSSRNDVPDDMISVFKNMSKEELLRVVITSKAQMIRKDQYIKDLENYIDDLLVRVMETTPRLLSRQPFHKL